MTSFLQTIKIYLGDKDKRANIVFYLLLAFFLLANYGWEAVGRYGIATAAVGALSFGISDSYILVRGGRKITNRSIVKLAIYSLAIVVAYLILPKSAWSYILALSGIITVFGLWISSRK